MWIYKKTKDEEGSWTKIKINIIKQNIQKTRAILMLRLQASKSTNLLMNEWMNEWVKRYLILWACWMWYSKPGKSDLNFLCLNKINDLKSIINVSLGKLTQIGEITLLRFFWVPFYII